MPSALGVGPLVEALRLRLFPTITRWNRLEARPRTLSFERALRAEIRDPLWMLTKQWQMGEFRGSDAGSPTFAKLQMSLTRLTKYQPDAQATQLFENDIPLEAKVERRPVALTSGGRAIAFDLRLAMGREWLRLIDGVGPYRDAFTAAYPVVAPDPAKKEDADRLAHPEAWQVFAAVAGRAIDGGALYEYLEASPANHAYDGIGAVAAADFAAIDAAAARFLAWFARLLTQPPAAVDNAWIPERLEYQFAASSPEPDATEKVYVADEFHQDRLDWYSFDVDASVSALGAAPGSEVTGLPPQITRAMMPIPVSFAGMPNTRWWTFEDNRTNFGDIDAATTDLAKLLFMEFALVYSNDWFVIPFTLPSGAVASIDGFVVTNVFNERFFIEAAGSGADAAWQRWSMFTVDVRNKPGAAADTSLMLPPTLAKIQRSAPIEDVMLVRDEVANMVWGIETTIPLATGEPKRGIEAARQTLAFLERQLAVRLGGPPPPPPPAKAPIRYEVMITVPENWIPFIPVHVPGSNREIQIQRAALPRILQGDPDPPVKVQPRTALLREGLDRKPAQPYFVHEEEVSRAGTRVMQTFERTRWTDGRVYTWLRVVRQTGRGEGSSGLAFDQLANAPSPDASS
jgi:hypothetical protein